MYLPNIIAPPQIYYLLQIDYIDLQWVIIVCSVDALKAKYPPRTAVELQSKSPDRMS